MVSTEGIFLLHFYKAESLEVEPMQTVTYVLHFCRDSISVFC